MKSQLDASQFAPALLWVILPGVILLRFDHPVNATSTEGNSYSGRGALKIGRCYKRDKSVCAQACVEIIAECRNVASPERLSWRRLCKLPTKSLKLCK